MKTMYEETVSFCDEFQAATRTSMNSQLKDLKHWAADPTEGKEIYPNYWAAKGWRCVKSPYKQ